jgi:hypothetical protein
MRRTGANACAGGTPTTTVRESTFMRGRALVDRLQERGTSGVGSM